MNPQSPDSRGAGLAEVLRGAAVVAEIVAAAAREVSRALEPVFRWAKSPEGAAALRFAVAFVEDARRRGGGDGAVCSALVKVGTGHEPDALLLTALRGPLEERPLTDLPGVLNHHGRRLAARALASKAKEDVAKVRGRIKLYPGVRAALDGLGRDREETLEYLIRLEMAEDPDASAGVIAGRVGNRVRREARIEAPTRPARLEADLGAEELELALFIDRESVRQDAVRAGFSGSERETFGLLLDGRSVEEVARTRGKSASQIRQEKARILKKIGEYRRTAGM